jgi:hypothetical protein
LNSPVTIGGQSHKITQPGTAGNPKPEFRNPKEIRSPNPKSEQAHTAEIPRSLRAISTVVGQSGETAIKPSMFTGERNRNPTRNRLGFGCGSAALGNFVVATAFFKVSVIDLFLARAEQGGQNATDSLVQRTQLGSLRLGSFLARKPIKSEGDRPWETASGLSAPRLMNSTQRLVEFFAPYPRGNKRVLALALHRQPNYWAKIAPTSPDRSGALKLSYKPNRTLTPT